MIPQSLKSFVSRLRRETDTGNVRWSAGAEESFFCNHGEFTVVISYHFDEDALLPIYRMDVSAAKGRDASFAVNAHENDIQDMRDLYSSVSVSAAGFDNIEDEFFKS